MPWVEVELAEDVAVGEMARVVVNDIPICLVRAEDGNLYAISDSCPHEGASLSEGWTYGMEVECPRHNSVFDLRTGEALSLPARDPAAVYEVTVEGALILVDLPAVDP